jgi:SagB-type dehydrogenase family enzyme
MTSPFRSLFQPKVGESLGDVASPQEAVRQYHQRTKHRLQGYAAGPEALDWDAQPNPFRTWADAPRSFLPLKAASWPATWLALREGHVAPASFSREGLAMLLELSFGLTAWKQLGPDKWALRANPSSGNLHPTEVYVIAQGLDGLPDGLYHYEPRDHALSQRASGRLSGLGRAGQAGLWLGLSSVHWREAWKYGERAFRYAQLDTGHALGAVRYAAAALGWQARWLPAPGHVALASVLGLDRDADFVRAEREEAEGLVAIWTGDAASPPGVKDHALDTCASPTWAEDVAWTGQASCLDPRPMYQWPVINEVARATRGEAPAADPAPRTEARSEASGAPLAADDAASPRDAQAASQIIRERRSAQHFDRRAQMSHGAFLRILSALMPYAPQHTDLPWDAWPWAPGVHVVVYAHRVDGMAPGAYVLPRSAHGQALLQAHLVGAGGLAPVPGLPVGLPLLSLAEHPALAGTVRTLSCHQAIGSDACVAFSLIGAFDGPIDADADASAYRRLLQEAGLIGQALYLNAEAEGLRGTGIGCYFDDAVHELLGLKDQAMQVLYHFTVGQAMVDSRLQSEPPYTPERQALDTPLSWP